MKLNELVEEKQKTPDGTYAGVRFTKKTVDAIIEFCDEHDIPNPIKPNKFHTTLLYSRKYLPDYKPKGKYDSPLVGKPGSFDIWRSKPTDGSDPAYCLVLKYSCPELTKRHEELMKEHGATFDYDEYRPHITLSYDVGKEFDLKDLPEFDGPIEIELEYSEDLNLNWAKDNSLKDK